MKGQIIKSVNYFIMVGFLLFSIILTSDQCRAQDGAYCIGPEDILSLSIIAGGKTQYEGDLTVSPAGMINVIFIGQIKIKGLTTNEIAERIREPLIQDYFVKPQVNVSVKEYHSLHYYISGAVANPGLYKSTSKSSLLQLIATAGGMVMERGNVAYILRSSDKKTKEPIKVDLTELLDKGNITYNILLQSGDEVYIPQEKSLDVTISNVYVGGEVKNPGVYPFQAGMTALNACIMAGGFDKFAAPNRAKIIRKDGDEKKIIKLNLDDVKKGKSEDVELKPGDMINIPETWL